MRNLNLILELAADAASGPGVCVAAAGGEGEARRCNAIRSEARLD
jgi:hypothetical protein